MGPNEAAHDASKHIVCGSSDAQRGTRLRRLDGTQNRGRLQPSRVKAPLRRLLVVANAAQREAPRRSRLVTDCNKA